MKKSEKLALCSFAFSMVGYGVTWATADWLWSVAFFVMSLITGITFVVVGE